MMKYIYILLGLVIVFSSCKKEYETIKDIDEAKIQAYLKSNGISATKDPSGFYYQILDPGTGGVMLNKDSVFYNVTVKSLNGQVYYAPAEFSTSKGYLGYVTPESYRIAMNAINRGGKVRVIVPSYLAYGKNGSGPVPPNEVIVSEITTYTETTQLQTDDRLIREFITAKGITATKSPDGIYYNISAQGADTEINRFSTIKVKYDGRFLSGTSFDKREADAPLEIVLDDTIRGWQKMLIGKKKGVKMRIIIPSDLGYGGRQQTGIPTNSCLDFDIEIIDVTN